MLVGKSCCLLLTALAVTGCGPDVDGTSDWMLGTFSNTRVHDQTIGLASLGRYEFREDGTLTRIARTHCGENREEIIQEYRWRRDGDSVIVDLQGPEGGVDEWLITLGATCDTLIVDEVVDGKVFSGFTLWRGEVCMRDLPPCGGLDCPSCETVWCEEPPAACSD